MRLNRIFHMHHLAPIVATIVNISNITTFVQLANVSNITSLVTDMGSTSIKVVSVIRSWWRSISNKYDDMIEANPGLEQCIEKMRNDFLDSFMKALMS